jgi:KUP system potassium uptake protein
LQPNPSNGTSTRTLALAALGVVFGDIGTSPLYAFRTCFDDLHGAAPTPDNVLGLLSLVFWALTAVISIKYVGVILRADNRGEGGALALFALVNASPSRIPRSVVMTAGLLGAALFFSDGAITPAISVLSAVEGIEVANDELGTVVVPLVLVILLTLFSLQRRGTGAIGALFGPVMVVWFSTLAVMGLSWIVREPAVLAALDPGHALRFLLEHRSEALIVLAAVFLAVTGGEALYADMGHFGRGPIRWAWFGVVLPALVLNYFGQGALVLSRPESVASPFYLMVPGWALAPLVLLATAATVIASQAVISGVFSVAHQALQLGFLPRFTVIHSSGEAIGQVYVPAANRLMLLASSGLVLGFGSSENLAAAYGIAISLAMTIDTVLVMVWLSQQPGRSGRALLGIMAATAVLDVAFVGANSLKIPHGGWLPLLASAALLAVMLTWHQGRVIAANRALRRQTTIHAFLRLVNSGQLHRAPGTAVYLDDNPGGIPRALQRLVEAQGTLHERVVLLTVEVSDEPRTRKGKRVKVSELAPGLYRVIAQCGFMESPNVPGLLREAEDAGLPFRPAETVYVLGFDHIVVTRPGGMDRWRKRLFALMSRNAAVAAQHFALPSTRVIEGGEQLEI